MPAYIIVMREEPVADAAAFAQYQTLTRQMTVPTRPMPRVVYGQLQALEGDAPDGVVMLEFPSMDEARSWYFSADYQQALPHRLRSAKHRAFLVEGFTPPV